MNSAHNPRHFLAHYGIRAKNYREMVDWYRAVFGATIEHENEFIAFLTFDDEHHRLVIFEDPETVEKPPTAAGIDHVGYSVASFGDLIETYLRLKSEGITPFAPVNHRFSTSLYYHDPDGNEVELSVDNFATKQECRDFVRSTSMDEIGRPPFGYIFDPEELVTMYRAGATLSEMARIGLPAD